MGKKNYIYIFYWLILIFKEVERKKNGRNMYFTASLLTVYGVSSKVRAQSKARTYTTQTHSKSASHGTFAALDWFSQ
uniref:Putative secreted protein n=1 Tax=Ixodes ricinus TaxID=34613 RepID=A0A6B0TUD0_IXORI